MLSRAERILVCLRYGIGDVVMQLPAMEALRRSAPAARITALGAAPATELLEGAGLVDDIAALGEWGIEHLWDPGHPHTAEMIDRWLERERFELALNPTHAPRAIQSAITCKGVQRLEADEGTLRAALDGGLDAVAAFNRAVAAGWGLEAHPEPRPVLRIAAAEAATANDFLLSRGMASRPLAVCPGASLEVKRWPAQRFAGVADRAIEAHGTDVLMFAAEADGTVEAVLQAMRHADRAAIVRGEHLRRVAALLARCAALVTNDTGLMHIAAAAGTPVVAVFGPTLPRVYLPPGRHAGIRADVDCQHEARRMDPPDCWASDRCLIAEESCVRGVQVEAVSTALDDILGRACASRIRS